MSRELSFEYMKKFLEYVKDKLDYEPIVLGGWAVYALTKKEMSVDVDVLLKSKLDINKVKEFFDKNEFKMEKDNQGNVTFEKNLTIPLEIDDVKIDSIIFDVILKDELNLLHESNNVNVPWALCFDYNKKVRYENLELTIPSPELLLVYKVKAYRDRNYDKFKFVEHMKHKTVWLSRKDFKINKDKRDVSSLVNSGLINHTVLEEILIKTSFKRYFDETIDKILEK